MTRPRTATALARILGGTQALVLPGAHDPLSAKLVEEVGFPAVYVGSYATAAAGYGLADVGALTLDEIVRHAKAVADAVSVPVIADAEGGFFDPGNIWRTVDAFERAGVAAIHIEDHAGGKHTTLPQSLIPLDAMRQKLRHICTHVRTKIITISLASIPDPSAWDGAADLVIDYGFCLRATTKALKESLKLAKTREPEAFGPKHLESEAAFEARLGYADFTRRAEKYQ